MDQMDKLRMGHGQIAARIKLTAAVGGGGRSRKGAGEGGGGE